MVEYSTLMHHRLGVVDVVQMMTHKWLGYSIYPLQKKDRLKNPKIDFPIGIAFGDRDVLGSEGAEDILKENKHFKSGKTQLFKVTNCGSRMPIDQPEKVCNMLIGFFEEETKGVFQVKKRDEITFTT